MKRYYPVALNISGSKTLIVGGGLVAQRKALSLLQAGGAVKIVSPSLTSNLKRLAKSRKIKWICRKVRRSDLSGSGLVIAATDDLIVNSKVSQWAKAKGILVNVVDKPALSTFISPAVFKSGKAIVAVYTDGRDPVLSRDLKNYIKGNWNGFLSCRFRPSKG
ncbi:MAG: bifunctional precorrin-2 dehydrogenase/sirohydrochlorin ferrochelatase [Candidatus Omnitrophica bacterium]|nr:bifunctional precorrin-2 dehydrogenase/sirohydrochlorin ferrochelatase [Candidatus Omnitrophota bacterium]